MQFYRRPQFDGYECLAIQTRYRYDEGCTWNRQYRACNAVQFLYLYSLKQDAQPSPTKQKK